MQIINNDIEAQRMHRNRTKTQIKVADSVREGVVLNSNLPLKDSYDSLLISNKAELPNNLYERNTKKEKGLLPIAAATVGFMGALAGITGLIAKSARDAVDIDLPKRLCSMTRNVCVNKEIDQAIYRVVANPNKKTTLAFAGLAVFSSMAFMGKTFCEGFKDVWVKKKEADIQKNLQENLIEVETQSFSGKMKIIRNMLSEKAREFNHALIEEAPASNSEKNNTGNPLRNNQITFKGTQSIEPKKEAKNKVLKNIGYMAIGALSTAAIVGLGYLSMKNLRSSNNSMKRGVEKVKEAIADIVENSEKKPDDKRTIMNLFTDISADSEYVKSTADKMSWNNEKEKKDFIKESLFNINKSTEKADSALGGSGQDRNTFYSHVSDYKAFFYNYLIDSQNKQFQNLFFGITGATATAYLGELSIDAIKDVQVKKYNAETELNLQQRLVSTELRNFKSKKDASIEPLCDEFYRQKQDGKPKEELKVVADNILNEIKNGAPYVYA